VRVGEIKMILAVTTKTLCHWGWTVKAKRHPVNAYRIYLRQEFEDPLNQRAKLNEAKRVMIPFSPARKDSAMRIVTRTADRRSGNEN
jgi:hypothetical protein